MRCWQTARAPICYSESSGQKTPNLVRANGRRRVFQRALSARVRKKCAGIRWWNLRFRKDVSGQGAPSAASAWRSPPPALMAVKTFSAQVIVMPVRELIGALWGAGYACDEGAARA